MKKLFTSSRSLWVCLFAMMMMASSQSAWAEYVKLTALSGSKDLANGEGCGKLVDQKVGTKWGQSFDPGNPDRADAWIVVKAEKAVVPSWYFLVTGNDTGNNPTRNWKKWNIYGANFDSDEAAVRGSVEDPAAAGWTLLDERDGDPLPEANSAPANFQFNQAEGNTAYQYYWIEVLESVQGSDVYLQMDEWGLGTYDDFVAYVNRETSTSEPVGITLIAGDRIDNSGESLTKLFDNDINTKWGNGLTEKNYGETTNGAHFIIKTSRAMAPEYYRLVTGTDNESWNNRNWYCWQIYAIADADVKDGKPARDSDKWVLLDKKDKIGKDVLPDKNKYTVVFDLSEENTTKYHYFKVEIDKVQSGGGGYMQMGEFSLGDQYTLQIDCDNLASRIEENYDPNLFAEKALLDRIAKTLEGVKTCTNAHVYNDLVHEYDEEAPLLSTSISKYAELITVRNTAINLINDENLNAAAMAYAQAWISETDAIAPGDEYPAGNFGYIKANRQLTGDEASAESKRFNNYLQLNVNVVEDPIYPTYTAIEGFIDQGFGGNESGASLVDGDRDNTKWCSPSEYKPWRLIFKSDEPIKPSYYGLVTGGDTGSYPGRNWKSWKIWGANFDSDEEVSDDSDKWVLIDDKQNVGTDVLKTTSLFESYINLSVGCAVPYQYFKIVVEDSRDGGTMQMNEFSFYNMGNLAEYRESFVSEFESFDPESISAYIGYIKAFQEKYQELQTCTHAPDVMKLYNELKELEQQMYASEELYQAYLGVYDEFTSTSIDSESMSDWAADYMNEVEGPGVKFIRGTHEYIMSTLSLDNEAIVAETYYIQSIINAANDGLYILIDGHTVEQWGDGFYGHIIDGIALNTTEIDPETGEEVEVWATKWGGQADPDGNTYVIFRTLDPVNPFFYTLTTGNDTGVYTGRNWGTWYIYGGNFEGDGAATKDAEGWVLVDSKENVGQDRLHPVNAEPSYFGFSSETTTEYTYYKVVVTKAYSGTAIQMNELYFGTEEEFDVIKNGYIDAANEFDYDVVADQKLIDEYEAVIEDISECVNMEALFRCNYRLEELRSLITTSAQKYAVYMARVADEKAYLEANTLAESEALTVFSDYLNESVEPSEVYPNGSAEYIIENHLLNDSTVIAELDFIETLKVAAVAAGYGKGTDISSLIVNRKLEKASATLKDEDGKNVGREAEGWNGYIYRTATNEEMTMAAAEFCNENSKFDINQTLTNLKNGYYKVTLNAGFRACGDLLSYNYAAMAYANDAAVYVPVIREDVVADSASAHLGTYPDKMIYSTDSTETYGLGIWGCEGAAHAFLQGRYAVTLVALVEDGTLTIGLKNEGTSNGGDWTGAGNFGLIYLGEEEADAAEAFAEVAAYDVARIATMTDLYEAADPFEAAEYRKASGYGAEQKNKLGDYTTVNSYAAEVALGELMQSIYEAKKSYVALNDASDKVYNHWIDAVSADDLSMEEAVYEVKDLLVEGAYADSEAAVAAKAALYAAWPDYLGVKGGKGTNVEYTRENFAFDINTTGVNPSLSLTGLYEALEEDEVILAFDYVAAQDVVGGSLMYETPNLLTDVVENFATMPATEEWTTVYVNVSKGIKAHDFGTSADHSVRWSISNKASKENLLSLGARNFRFMTKAAMKAAGGSPLNGETGDFNNDGVVNVADAVSILAAMAAAEPDEAYDLTGDGVVNVADYVAILVIMASAE